MGFDDFIQEITIIFIIMAMMLGVVAVSQWFLPTISNTESNTEIATEVSTEIIEEENSIINSSIINEQSSELIESEKKNDNVDMEEYISAFSTVEENMNLMIKYLCHVVIIINVVAVFFMLLRIFLDSFGGFPSLEDFVPFKNDNFIKVIRKKRDKEINNEIINTAILKSGKIISRDDIKFLQDCIDRNNDWYTYKKDIKVIKDVKIDEDDKVELEEND